MSTADHIIERYRKARERLKQANARGDADEAVLFEAEVDSIWKIMSGADRRSVLGVGEEKRAA